MIIGLNYLQVGELLLRFSNRPEKNVKCIKQGCGSGSGSGRIRNVLPGSGSGIIIPDPDPTLKKKKVGSFNIFTLKEGGGNLPVTVN